MVLEYLNTISSSYPNGENFTSVDLLRCTECRSLFKRSNGKTRFFGIRINHMRN